MTTEDILFHEKEAHCGLIGEIILNRPRALNALTLDMCQRFCEQLNQWDSDEKIKAVIVKGNGDRAFCAGGDIRKLYENRDKDPKQNIDFFWHEYRLNAFIHHFSKPYFAFLHHATMGGGAGISIHGTYRLATENLIFAMPETKIGFYPDIGASYFLNQCPGYTGLYLALTGNTIDAFTAQALGLVTHLVPENKMADFESALYQTNHISEQIIKPFTRQEDHSKLKEHYETINHCFSAISIEAILQRLEHYNDWSKTVAQQLKERCPSSLKITLEAQQRAKKMNFNDIMQMDFDIAQQFLTEPDFFEGIRAMIIDKDQKPTWQPEIPDAKMEEYFQSKGSRLLSN